MHSRDRSSTQQQSNASLQGVQEEAHLSGHQGSWDDPAVKKRGETERHISFQHEAVKQVEAPGHGISHCRELASQTELAQARHGTARDSLEREADCGLEQINTAQLLRRRREERREHCLPPLQVAARWTFFFF